MPVVRWEDLIPRWSGAEPFGEVIGHHPSVVCGPLAVGLWAAPALASADVGSGTDGRDLLVACWDACFEGGVYRFRGLTAELNVEGPAERIPGLFGNVDSVPLSASSALLSVTRDRPEVLLRQGGSAGEPAALELEILWVRGPETLHVVRACDLDGDGMWDLLIGTDDWTDYWPDRREWNDPDYRPYDAGGGWRGGPLRGHVYAALNSGTNERPRFERARPLVCGSQALEVYGAAAPAWADFLVCGRPDLVCGDFLDQLWFFRHVGGLAFDPPVPVLGPDGRALKLPQNIHVPIAVPSVDGRDGHSRPPALLVGAEDGLVQRLAPLSPAARTPAYAMPGPVLQPWPPLHPGIVPVPTVCDWTNGGGRDLIIGTGGGWLRWYPDLGGDPVRRHGEPLTLRTASRPIRIQAGHNGSIQGPSEAKWGYLCPTAADWDDDGRVEILASDVMGRHLLFARTGDPSVLEEPVTLRYGSTPLRTAWRVRPAVTEWGGARGDRRYVCVDSDGLLVDLAQAGLDLLSDKRVLRYADGVPIAFTEDGGGGLGRVKLAVCDWTGSGLGDLLVGTHARASVPPGLSGAPRHTHGQATVLLLENLGTPGHPTFGRPRQLCYRGAPVRYGMHACSPAPADWFGRGVLDLVVGAESGTLVLLRREWLTW